MTDFKTYYKQDFRHDLQRFVGQIPIEGNKHYDKEEFNIQYFFLTPNYKYLDIIPTDKRGLFAVALFWTVLIDQVFYTHFRFSYQTFPKFIGNCTAPSLMSSECGHCQHPKRIFQAINDIFDKGNRFDFDREIFKSDENCTKREQIHYLSYLEQSKEVMQEEIKDYFETHQPEIEWTEFWAKCEKEL